jgi:hypothetical protein
MRENIPGATRKDAIAVFREEATAMEQKTITMQIEEEGWTMPDDPAIKRVERERRQRAIYAYLANKD